MKKFWLGGSMVATLLVASACGVSSEEVSDDQADGDANGEQEETNETDTNDSEYEIQFAHVVAPGTAKGQAADYFAEQLEERTDGRIAVDVYPDSQLGSDREIIEQMQSGTVEMNAPFTGVLPSFVPQYQVYDLPYLFEDREHAFEMSTGELGEALNEYLPDQDLRFLGFWDGGFKHFTNSDRPIETLEDMQGLSMRASQSPLLISQFEAWGASAESIDLNELYTSLEQGTVDGQENPLSNIVSQSYYEAQDYMTYSEHGYMGYPLLISETFYQELPEDLQETLHEVADEVNEWQWDVSEESEEEYAETLEEESIEINELSDEEREEFREASEEVYDEFRDTIEDGEELLDIVEN
ncbi:TRAP transporter substrate-binding protein [Salicibibacter kimchii]|nr:TRAP transporter substrate-binding protein [Salicibibacter kimchii]